ncbi:MAG: hydrolase [Acidobacteriota bacterium]
MKILVASDIFGETRELRTLAGTLCDDFLIASPYPDPQPTFIDEEAAYASFLSLGGIAPYAEKLALQIDAYRPEALVGFSVGATAGWLALSGVVGRRVRMGVLFYGSRIRDFMGCRPGCPVRLFFAEYEKSFVPVDLAASLRASGIEANICGGCRHGFMNRLSSGYDEAALQRGIELIRSALTEVSGTP